MADKNSAETATKAAKPAVNVEDKKAAAQAEVDALVKKAQKALVEFEKLDQQAVDRIVAKASVAALNKHLVLAKLAVDETGRGLVEDKATKNIFACEHGPITWPVRRPSASFVKTTCSALTKWPNRSALSRASPR